MGKYNTLRVVKEVDFGMYLDGGIEGEILLPKRYVPQDCKPGDDLEVFIYLDQDERLVATTQKPLAQVGDFACLEVSWVNQYGAFLNWGLMKDLFVPFREQKMKMEVGRKYIVHVHLDDESFRIVASAKVDRYLSKEKADYKPGQEVEVLVWQKTDLGFKAIIDNKYSGLLYESEIFQPLHAGMKLKAYVKQVRDDGKIDLLGVSTHKEGANICPFVDAMLTWYGYPKVPIAKSATPVSRPQDGNRYADVVVEQTDDKGKPLYKRSKKEKE